jgi:DNA-binding transcriptional LysR family regulator
MREGRRFDAILRRIRQAWHGRDYGQGAAPVINVRHLAVFRAVMKSGSVSAAARILNVSQPAVTKTLQQIEGRIGVPLFRRRGGRLHATPESLLLMPKIDQVFGAVEEVERLAEDIAGGSAGRVAIATVSTLSAAIAAAAVSRHKLRRPKVVIRVDAFSTRQVVEEVINNQVDLGIVDLASGENHLAHQDLCVARIGCVMPRGHRLASRREIEPDDLRGEVLIAFNESTIIGWLLRERFRQLNTPIEIAITTNQCLIACSLVASGTGLALIDPFLLLSDMFPSLAVVPLTPAVELRPRIIFPPTRPLSIVARDFVETVKDTVHDLVPSSPLLRSLAGSLPPRPVP